MKPNLFITLFTLLALAEAQLTPTDTQNYCESGYFDNGNYCQRCPPRFASNDRSFSCTPCPPGQYVTEVVRSRYDSDDIYYFPTCSKCPPGYYITGDRCVHCPLGSYSGTKNSKACTLCPKGQNTVKLASTSKADCYSCNKGTFFDVFIDHWTCEGCYEGAYQDEPNQYTCKLCPRGTTSDIHAQKSVDKCEPCLPGFYAPEDEKYIYARSCEKCPPGFYSSQQAALNCTKCPSGTKPNLERTACVSGNASKSGLQTCPPGTGRRSLGAPCTPCPKGTVSVRRSATQCVSCTGGFVADSDGTSCKCPPNTVPKWEDGRAKCAKCPAGSSWLNNRTCSCPEDQFYDSKYAECRCKPFTGKARNGTCVPCDPSGSSGGDSGVYDCTVCERDYRPSRDGCVPCPLGYSSDYGDKECRKCELTYVDKKGRTRCGCPAGQQKSWDKCVPCPRGEYFNRLYRSCRRCPEGYFSSDTGQTKCKLCPEGQRYGDVGSDSCPPKCPEGAVVQYGNCVCGESSILMSKGSQFTCKPCPAGKVSYDRKTCTCRSGTVPANGTCTPCPPGLVSYSRDQTCTDCDAGSVPSEDQSGCMECPEGTFTLVPRGAECYSCEEGTYHTLAGGCGRCEPGFRVRKGECVPCVDSVSKGGDASFCKPCPNGTKPSSDGATCV